MLISLGKCINVADKAGDKSDNVESDANIEISSQILLEYNNIAKQANFENKTYPGQERAVK